MLGWFKLFVAVRTSKFLGIATTQAQCGQTVVVSSVEDAVGMVREQRGHLNASLDALGISILGVLAWVDVPGTLI